MPSIDSAMRKPLYISWAIDSALALAILAAVWQGGQFIERLETVATQLESLGTRVAALEQHPLPNNTSARVGVLEVQVAAQERSIRDLKEDLVKRLDRIEAKVDRLQ